MKLALAMIVAIAAFLGTLPANAQVIRCDDRVYREARDCPGARKPGTITIPDTRPAPPAVPMVPAAQYDAMRGATPASTAGTAPYQGETPPQYMARWEVYCVSQAPAQRAECRVQAKAQTQLYSANYQAAFNAEMLRRTEESLRKLRETPRAAPAFR